MICGEVDDLQMRLWLCVGCTDAFEELGDEGGPAEEGHEAEPALEIVIPLEVENEGWQSELKRVIEDVVHIAKARLKAQLGEQ